MNPAWLQQKKDTPSFVVTLINTSKANGCWIYHVKMKRFYTPEEFQESWNEVIKSDSKANNFQEFKIVDPLFAVRLTSSWVNEANKRQQEVISKLEAYEASFKVKK